MFGQITTRSVITVLALFVGLISVGMQSLPAGSVVCMELGGHFALESSAALCCTSMVDKDGDSIPDPCPPESGVVACKNCLDLYLPHDRFDLGQLPAVFIPAAIANLPVVAIIDWPAAHVASYRRDSDAHLRSPHLIQIATVIIRC